MIETQKSPNEGQELIRDSEFQFLCGLSQRMTQLKLYDGNDVLQVDESVIDCTDYADASRPIDLELSFQSTNLVVKLHVIRFADSNERTLVVQLPQLPGMMKEYELLGPIEEYCKQDHSMSTVLHIVRWDNSQNGSEIDPTPDFPPFLPNCTLNYEGHRIRFVGAYGSMVLFFDIETGESVRFKGRDFQEMLESGVIFPASSPVQHYRNETQLRARQISS